MFDKVMNFLNKNNILYEHQYGFRAKHSTIQPIIHFLNHCANANNKKKSDFTLAILCDLSKTFEVITYTSYTNSGTTHGVMSAQI